MGLLAGFFFWMGEYRYGVIGALLFQFSAILDCCDGEVARIKSMQSPIGWWLDLVSDNIVHVGLFLAISWSVYRQTGSAFSLGMGLAASVGTLLSLGFVLLLEKASLEKVSRGERRGLLGKVLDRATNRDFSLIVLLFALTDRLQWFLWLAVAGANIFWLLLLWLYRREVRLST